MKRICFLLVFSVIACMLSAQATNAGKIMIGGDLNGAVEMGQTAVLDPDGETLVGSEIDVLQVGLIGKAGYFVIDNFEIGPIVQFVYRKMSDPENADNYMATTNIGIGIQFAYYIGLGGQLSAYIEAAASYVMESSDMSGTTGGGSGFQIMPGAGVAIFLTEDVALQIGAALNFSRITDDDSELTDQAITYGLTMGIRIFK